MTQETATYTDTSDIINIPPDLWAKAEEKRWPLVLLREALAHGVPAEQLHQALDSGLTAAQAREMMTSRATEVAPELSLRWTKVDTERGVRARPGKKGLTIDAINIGSYGVVPDHWDNQTMTPRGAYLKPGAMSMGYSIYSKAEVWSDNLGALYEEAIQRRWRPATDIPWESVSPLPEDIERAICQLCTELCEYNYMVIVALGKWIREICYGYHEAKLFLSTVLFDAGRHFEAFRKRALANGGGLGVQSPAQRLIPIRDAENFSEMAALVFLLNDSFVQSLYLLGAGLAHSEAEARLFGLAAQDKSRHLAYGVAHLRYLLEHQPERWSEFHKYLQKGEEYVTKDFQKFAPHREALAILLGGGLRQIGEGFRLLDEFRRKQISTYLARLEAAGLSEHRERLWPPMAAYLEKELVTA
jgi:hypothetical protein